MKHAPPDNDAIYRTVFLSTVAGALAFAIAAYFII